MINKKKVFKCLIIVALLIIIIVASIRIRQTLARYETLTSAQRDVDVAFWFVDNSFKSERILIQDIYPSETAFEYEFLVTNFNNTKSAETDLEYEIEIITTTNLPLSYQIKKNGSTCTKVEQLYTDEDGTYYRKIKLETATNRLIMYHENDTIDYFTIKVLFPKENSANLEYADIMEDIQINLTAKQIIEE